MANRQTLIARSIVFSLLRAKPDGEQPAAKIGILSRILALFRLYELTFQLVRPDLFRALRGVWDIDEGRYRASFRGRLDDGRKVLKSDVDAALKPMGDMGYSGSTFFRTTDGAYLVKSIPRHFEHAFFKNDLLLPYAEFMQANPGSLLVRMTDFLESTHLSIGLFFGLAPSHHVIMENIMYGQDSGSTDSSSSSSDDQQPRRPKWEHWDLKPTSYFYPERDVAGGALASEATKSKLADKFDDTLRLSKSAAADFWRQLEKDTQLLADHNAVDYSLFLVRVSPADDVPDPEARPPLEAGGGNDDDNNNNNHSGPSSSAAVPPSQPPFAPPGPPSWRTGVLSSDGAEVYRAAVLDFFWAKHTAHAKAMTGLIQGYNLIDEQGPMSITTESREYRERFLKMCAEIVEVTD